MSDRFRPSRKTWIFLAVTGALIALDQGTKILVHNTIRQGRERVEVIDGFLAFVHAQNPGAAIGLLGDLPTPIRMTIFGVFTVIAAGVILSMLWQLPRNDRFQSTTLGFIMAGALGNAIDRAVKQSVTDFILVYTDWPPVADWLRAHGLPNEYPTFNIADSAIFVGVGLFLVRYLFLDDAKEADEPDDVPARPSTDPPATP